MERLPGFRDFYPEPVPAPDLWSADVRRYVFERWRETARRYHFREYDGPPLEPLELYTAKSGEEIIGQLYHFVDKGKRAVALRPEMTPTLARMVAAYERAYKKPIKWFAIPQLFRHERQQRGRLREHFQFNADIVGEAGAGADAELIALLIDTLRGFGLTAEDFVVRLSSREVWEDFFRKRCADAARAYEFFQAVDKLERDTEADSSARFARLGFSLAEVRAFAAEGTPTAALADVVKNLAARGLADYVKIDYGVIRGLAYYTGTVFEAFDKRGEFRALAGGGRYDRLVQALTGGRADIPALGFGMGDVVLVELLKARGLLPGFARGPEVFVLVEDESLRGATLGLIQELREAGYAAEYSLVPAKAEKQFKRALEASAGWTLRLQAGPGPGGPGVVMKNTADRKESVVTLDQFREGLGRRAWFRTSSGPLAAMV